jgi:hypothetical protein
VDLGAAVVADEQAFQVVQPGEGALDDPAGVPEPGAVLRIAAGDHRSDPACTQQPAVLVAVVAAVCDHLLGPPPRAADAARDRGDGLDQRQQLLDVVAVRAGQAPGERDTGGVD